MRELTSATDESDETVHELDKLIHDIQHVVSSQEQELLEVKKTRLLETMAMEETAANIKKVEREEALNLF